MRTLINTAIAIVAGVAMLAPLAASAHDRDDHGRGRGHYKYDRYYGPGPRVIERTVVYRPAPVVVYREPRVIYREPVYVERAPVYYSRPAITIGVSVPPIVIPLR